MTAAAARAAPALQGPSRASRVFAGRPLLDERSAALAGRIEAAFLAEAGWDEETWVLTLPPDHPLLGRPVCRAPGCQTTCFEKTGICLDCRRRLAGAGLSLDDAGSLPPPRGGRWLRPGDGTCVVAGCPRPWVKAAQPLCPEHLGQQQRLGVSAAAFTGRADVVALPSHGTCAVAACPRQLPGRSAVYCDAHLQRLRCLCRAGRTPDELSWRLTEPPVPRAGQVSLAGLGPAVAVEILFGLQQRTRQGVKTNNAILRPVSNDARSQQVSSLTDLAIPARRGKGYASVVNTLVAHARRGMSDAGTEITKDTWDMALFGHQGRLSFTAITQPWLRQTAKIWAAADLPRRRGRSGGDKTRHYISSLALLSGSLRQRSDRGEDPAALGRADIEAFLGRLGWLHATGAISALTRVLACREVRKLLAAARQPGATRPGGPAAGLSDQFTVHRDDTPEEPEHGEPGRDLPPEIMKQICAQLRTLAAAHIRTATEILIDTGRRPEDVVALPLDCLASDTDGAPVLVYDNHKANRLGRRLPIPAATAQAIRAQAAARPGTVSRHPGQPAETAAHRLGQPRRPQAADRFGAVGRAPRLDQLAAAAGAGRRHRIRQGPGHPLRLPAYLRPAARRRGRAHRRARRAAGPSQPQRHPRLLPRRRATPPGRRRLGRCPLRHLHRAVQRRRGRERLPAAVPLRRLRPRPHRRLLPARPDRLPRRPAAHPGTARRRQRRRWMGTRRGGPLRAGDRQDPAAHQPHQR